MSVGDRIRAKRKARKLSISALGERVGRDKSWVSRIETGVIPARFDDIEKLAKALGCAARDLVPPRRAA